MKEKFRKFGVSEQRYEGDWGGSFDKEHQLNVLLADIDCKTWELAHLALYCCVYPESDAWGRLMRAANALYQQGDKMRFETQITRMRAYLNEKKA